MNTLKGREKFENYQIILDNVCSSRFVMGTLIKIIPKEDDVMQRDTQAHNITTYSKVRIDLTLP